MKIEITNIENKGEVVEIKAIVFSRSHLPKPNYEANETDEQYTERVKAIARDIDSYLNLHLGRATLTQELEGIKIPKVSEYDT